MSKKSITASVIHPGVQHSQHLAIELYKRNLLGKLVTSMAFSYNFYLKALEQGLPILHNKVKNRIANGLTSDKIKNYPSAELRYWIESKIDKYNSDNERSLFMRNKRFQHSISDKLISKNDIIIGYDTSSWILAKNTKKAGKIFILDQTIGHPISKDFFNDKIANAYPEWVKNIRRKKATSLLEAERIEHELADIIVAPSNFVKTTLIQNGVNEEKIKLNPFGTNTNLFKNYKIRNYDDDRLIFLFVGSISPRKGIPDLIKSWKNSFDGKSELWIVGYGYIPELIMKDFRKFNIKLLGKKSRDQLALIYNQAHVFVFPSYFEGLAQVQIEAIACGLPVVATFNSGADELIEHGKNGYIMNSGDVEALSNYIKTLANDRETLKSMSTLSDQNAKKLSWNAYGDRWVHLLENLF